MSRKVTFAELEVGMLTTEGLIKRIDPAGTTRFYGDEDSIHLFDLEDNYYGSCSRTVQKDATFEIMHERGTDEYRKSIQKLVEERYGYIHKAEDDIDFMRALMKP